MMGVWLTNASSRPSWMPCATVPKGSTVVMTSYRNCCTNALMLEASVGGRPSRSDTAMGGTTTWQDPASMRWNTTFSICVSVALAVAWLTSEREVRKML